MFSGQKWLTIALCQYSLWLLHFDTEASIFFVFFRVTEALLRCRVVIVAKLLKWRVPSSVNLQRRFFFGAITLKYKLYLQQKISIVI